MVYSVSTLSSSLSLSNYLIQHRANVDKAAIESISEKVADYGLAMGAQAGLATSFHVEWDMLQSQLDANSALVARMEVMTLSLNDIQTSGSEFTANLLALEQDTGFLETASDLAYTEIGKLVSSLNTGVGGVYLFGGINTDTAPMTAFEDGPEAAIETAFQTYFGFVIDDPATASIPTSGDPAGQDWETFLGSAVLNDIFGADWSPTWSSATEEKMTATISEGVTTTGSESADDEAFRELAKGLSIIAVFGKLDVSVETGSLISGKAVESLNVATNEVISLAAQVGAIAEKITSTNTDIELKSDMLNLRINDLENVDPARAAIELSLAQTQLEATYAITAQMKNLSIMNYL
ncbi:flagellar hook-associated protein FlgL [Pseudovibrio axinellae]|uniref:Flagellar hook-associated protein FlgL n=1 Tax=Pseudovibrio axinellae TaxID=989403 RepID=A0A165XJB6_9HYPH|nr:flagellar hook-associated family protein [Pseudovibrio axinellae]KZL17760.1 flagellar hook-associated protein FlgL [Pseudovibrio axinellae]SEP73725.1 flagellar hook-associated protein 3 FlgL [Pseudovibrio axinellae]